MYDIPQKNCLKKASAPESHNGNASIYLFEAQVSSQLQQTLNRHLNYAKIFARIAKHKNFV